jgi:transcriptional regulator with AAA-type ATPase domain
MAPAERERLERIFEALYDRALVREGRASLDLAEWLGLAERWRIRLALEQCHGDRTATARRLGIPRRSLYHRMRLLGLHGSAPGEAGIGAPAAPAPRAEAEEAVGDGAPTTPAAVR